MKRAEFDVEHGGNIYKLADMLKLNKHKIIDFSANINPLGAPEGVIQIIKDSSKDIINYPDPDTNALKQEIAKYHSIIPESIVCGNGSTELIYLFVRALKPKNVLIPAPTFSEYERACKTYRARAMHYGLKKENNLDLNPEAFIKALSSIRYDMVFLCNPNNPTGRLTQKKDVLRIAHTAKALKSYLIVDEAFIDFVPDASVIQEVEKNPYLIVIRSMTKFYALAGLRLGYGIFPLKIIDLIKQYKEPWTVNTLAQRAGISALNDTTYKKQTLELIKNEKQFLEKRFNQLGINFVNSCANFYLFRFLNAEFVYRKLKKKGILVRLCSDFKELDKTYIRVAVKNRKQNVLLLKELSQWLKA